MALSDLIRRGDDEALSIPTWALIALLLEFIIFIPLSTFAQYSLLQIYPLFAMLEDENAPSFSPLALSDADNGPKLPNADSALPPGPISSSLRSIRTLLVSHGGLIKSHFKGLLCALATTVLVIPVAAIIAGILPSPLPGTAIGALIAGLLTTQFHTAWLHIVITPPSKRLFWARLPPFRQTFNATLRPILLVWLASQAACLVTFSLAKLLGIEPFTSAKSLIFSAPTKVIQPRVDEAAKYAALVLIAGVARALFEVPARLALVRVQASLLPADQDTIFPFDRSFGGKVEPAVTGGRAWVSVSDALATFSRSSWRRLVVLYARIFGVCALGAVCFAIPPLLIVSTVMVQQGLLGAA